MQTIIAFILCAFITVSSGTIQQNTFIKSKDSVGMDFPDVPVVPGVRSRLQCAALCDQHSWCFAISWNQDKKTCQELTRVLIPETTTSGLYTAMFREDGYTYMAGMLVKFFGTGLPWQGAQDYCGNEGGRLVVLDTLEKYHAITTSPDVQVASSWWVGATRVTGTWRWTTGSTLELVVKGNDNGNCLGLYYPELYDVPCSMDHNIICEK